MSSGASESKLEMNKASVPNVLPAYLECLWMQQQTAVEDEEPAERGSNEVEERASHVHDHIQTDELSEEAVLSPRRGVDVGGEEVLVRVLEGNIHRWVSGDAPEQEKEASY